jgi:hypothetical protein
MNPTRIRNATALWSTTGVALCLTFLCVIATTISASISPLMTLAFGATGIGLIALDWRMLRAMKRAKPGLRQPHADVMLFSSICAITSATLLTSLLTGRMGVGELLMAVIVLGSGAIAHAAMKHVRAGTVRPPKGWAIERSRSDLKEAGVLLGKMRKEIGDRLRRR